MFTVFFRGTICKHESTLICILKETNVNTMALTSQRLFLN